VGPRIEVSMSIDDARLLEYYVQRGHGPWNLSLDAAWLDYELRRYVVDQLRTGFGAAVHHGISVIGDHRGTVIATRDGVEGIRDQRSTANSGGAARDGIAAIGDQRTAVAGGAARACVLDACDRVALGRPVRVCNIGIGVGLWDDWLGYVIGGEITSVDRDREICEVLELRQRRERHPHPARVICGDVLLGALDGQSFDVITCIGSTLHESGAPSELRRILTAALTPAGRLIVAEVLENAGIAGVALTCTSTGSDGRSIDRS
jgi:protein-L-isoaspartate O-methyltransferase